MCILSCDAVRRSAIVARFVQRRLDALYRFLVGVFHEHPSRFSLSPSRFFLFGKFPFMRRKFFFPAGLHFIAGDYNEFVPLLHNKRAFTINHLIVFTGDKSIAIGIDNTRSMFSFML